MKNEELVPTSASDIENADKDTVRLTSGRVFGIRKVNPIRLYDLGVLTLPDRSQSKEVEGLTTEQLAATASDDTKMLVFEACKTFIRYGVTSVNVVVDPKITPDINKNEISIYSLDKTEWLELAAAIDALSNFGVLSDVSGADASFPDAPESVGSGNEKPPTSGHETDAASGG